MKKKMVFIPVLLGMFLFIFSVPQVIAADTWARVSIDRIGQDITLSAGYFSHETSGTPIFTEKYFSFDDSSRKELLATCLTAFSLDKELLIRIKENTNIINFMMMYAE